MVGHQAVLPYLHPGLAGLFRQEIAINLLVSILEEDGLAPVAALGDMMRQTRDDQARKS